MRTSCRRRKENIDGLEVNHSRNRGDMSRELVSLSKTISHALRHAPRQYNLTPDAEGWVGVEEMLTALRHHRPQWQTVDIGTLEAVLAASTKQRFKIEAGRIRALYGHTRVPGSQRVSKAPPTILFHGTPERSVDSIMTNGLQPMRRRYVHLSTSEETAEQVGRRHGGSTVILQIDARRAHEDGVLFYEGNSTVWLCDGVPPRFIRLSTPERDSPSAS